MEKKSLHLTEGINIWPKKERKKTFEVLFLQSTTSMVPCFKLLHNTATLSLKKSFCCECFILANTCTCTIHSQRKQTKVIHIVYRCFGTCGKFVMDERAIISPSILLLSTSSKSLLCSKTFEALKID